MKPEKPQIKIKTLINKPVDFVWNYWTKPEHIENWNYASEDWHCTSAKNNLKTDGKFSWRMEAKNSSEGFDFSGVYTEIKENELIKKRLDDGRHVMIKFKEIDDTNTKVIETFEAEDQNPLELQEQGWQAILNNFKTYSELQPLNK